MFDLLQKPYLNKHNSIVALILVVIAFGAVVTADYLTSDELRFSALYLIIVLMVSWFCWIWWGSLFAFLSAFAEIKVGLLSGHSFSRLVYFYISVGNILFAYLLTAILASIARTLYERAKFSARIDHLTGIANGMGFYERVSVEMARHRRDLHPFAVAYIDCDNFKAINDNLGHKEGDRLLRTVGETLKSSLRETDVVARLGGDEFALVLPNTGEFTTLQITSKLHQKLDSIVNENKWPVTFSIGIGIFPIVPGDLDHVITFSDSLMYQAKIEGKNKIVHRVYNLGMEQGANSPT
jgi:diguanylate cyclase (GGDEF)-like protein